MLGGMSGGGDWADVSRIVADALEHPAPERQALLDRLCGDDAGLRQEVESLLAADALAGSFLDQAGFGLDGAAAAIAAAARQSLTVVPPLRLRKSKVSSHHL